MKSQADFVATIGLDWADEKHDLCLRPAGPGKAEHFCLEQKPQALHAWAAALRARFPEGSIALAVETSRGPLVHALQVYDFLVIYPVNPNALASYRKAFRVSGASDDKSDATFLEELARLHGSELRALRPDTELTRRLAGLVEKRRQLVDERTRLVNQLHSELKTYFPLAEELLPDMTTGLAADFLCQWGDLAAVQKTSAAKLRAFFYGHNCRSAELLEQRLEAVKKARALTVDPAIIIPARAKTQCLAAMLQPLRRAIDGLDEQIEQAMNEHPDAPIFRSFPGAGPVLAARLLSAFGSQRERFETALDVQNYYGLAPIRQQSGRSSMIKMRWRCPKFGRQSFHENADQAIKHEPWARAQYEQLRARQKGHHAAVRAVAFKLARIYTACWQTRQPYDRTRYEQALQKAGSPISASLPTQTPKPVNNSNEKT